VAAVVPAAVVPAAAAAPVQHHTPHRYKLWLLEQWRQSVQKAAQQP
jgi:hypothetical protein